MGKDRLSGLKDQYDVIVIGSGLGGLTAANVMAKMGRSVLVLEYHYQYGGLSTWFKRKGGHIFDISLHGFPYGMIKSCRKYWNRDIASRIEQLNGIRFSNPQFDLQTTYDKTDFIRILNEHFKIPLHTVENFFSRLAEMNHYEDDGLTTGELFEEYFPGRNDVVRLLMEPIAYANGSTLEDPALTYAIVFSNFMNKGVFVFKGGTDLLISKMVQELESRGVDLRKSCKVDNVLVEQGEVRGVNVRGKDIYSKVVISNAGLHGTIFNLVGESEFDPEFIEEARAVRLNNSSTQVYMGLREGESIPRIGDLVFTSTSEKFCSSALLDKNITSRTFSLYYPDMRPGKNRAAIVSSTNANYDDWAGLDEETYLQNKAQLIDETLICLERYIPGITKKVDHLEAATPRTFEHYTLHRQGASFGTKFEGLKVSRDLPGQIKGLFHAGSVGIIMSGWLGAMNYGVIVANEADKFICTPEEALATC